jgi:hypothetical protein
MPKIAFFNANGLAGKAEAILEFAKEQDIDIFFVAETWMIPDTSSPIRQPFLNITKPIKGILTGRTGTGGILGFCKPEFRPVIRTIEIDKENNYGILRILDYTVAVGYFSPALPNRTVTKFIDTVAAITNGWEEDTIILGDFNARHTAFGDSINSTRGRALLEHITNHRLSVQETTIGKYTSFKGDGKGIPDLVITAGPQITQFTAHEHETLGGSDHRPLTFEIESQIMVNREFTRWNVRKLAEDPIRQAYAQKMAEIGERELQTLQDVYNRIPGSATQGQEELDQIWGILKSWIDEAAENSCGKIKMEPYAKKSFWTDELIDMRTESNNRARNIQTLIAENTPRYIVQAAEAAHTQHNREFREAMSRRRVEMFDDVANELAKPQNNGAFLRMVKSTQARRSRAGCQLDPSKVNEHANHYRTTFGGDPLGNNAEFEGPNSIPEENNEALITFELEEVQTQLKRIPLGKAAGIDGIMAEFLAYASKTLAPHLCKLFNHCYALQKTPAVWKQALIVPVFKKKGSDAEIKNYRPIALTCVGRRLYERLLCIHLDAKMDLLSDFQGGFRPSRSTLDQAFCLHEILQQNPGATCVFLDLQAAYDMVDRRILWSRLYHKFGIHAGFIKRLQDLFDHNESILVVNGARSEPIMNRRGLLQGSSLSPILFNFFINELCELLNAPTSPKLTTSGYRTNSLLFADDANLHAANRADMCILLTICEHWSTRVGMRFAPPKCIHMGELEPEYTLYGEPLAAEEITMYLGLPFKQSGIAFEQSAQKRIKKAIGVTHALTKVGFNGSGWPARAAAQVYKSFIRPVMEYGSQLCLLPTNLCLKYQTSQNAALKAMFSVPRRTSSNALHKIVRVTPFSYRNKELHIRYICKLHNSQDASIPAVNLWWRIYQNQRPNSLVTKGITNPLWNQATKLNHVLNNLRRERSPYIEPYGEIKRKELQMKTICALERNKTTVAGAIQVEETDKHRHIIQANAFTIKAHRIAIQKWALGTIAWHQPCRRCQDGTELSRAHAVICSGASVYLMTKYAAHLDEESPLTVIDQLLNKFRAIPPTAIFYAHIFKAISLIYKRCMGYRLKENGYWEDDTEDDDGDSVASISTTDSEYLRRARAPPQRASILARERRQRAQRGMQPRRGRRPRRGIG